MLDTENMSVINLVTVSPAIFGETPIQFNKDRHNKVGFIMSSLYWSCAIQQ